MSEETYTTEEVQEMIRQYAGTKDNKHTFLRNVIDANDPTKLGNVNEDELGMQVLEVRGLAELEIFSRELLSNEEWADYFQKEKNMLLETSLSKEGFLVRMGGVEKQELADTTPSKKKENKGWFKKK